MFWIAGSLFNLLRRPARRHTLTIRALLPLTSPRSMASPLLPRPVAAPLPRNLSGHGFCDWQHRLHHGGELELLVLSTFFSLFPRFHRERDVLRPLGRVLCPAEGQRFSAGGLLSPPQILYDSTVIGVLRILGRRVAVRVRIELAMSAYVLQFYWYF